MSVEGNANSRNAVRGSVYAPETIHGKSAYEIAVMHGFDGTEEEWLESLKGADGNVISYDYMTEEQKADLISQTTAAVLAALPVAEGASF